jgi:hypothetical protein
MAETCFVSSVGFVLVGMTKNYNRIFALSNYSLLTGKWPGMDDRSHREIHRRSKYYPYLRRERACRDEVGAAKSREEVIERVFVGQVDRRQAQGQALVVGTQQIVGSEAQIEQMSRRYNFSKCSRRIRPCDRLTLSCWPLFSVTM